MDQIRSQLSHNASTSPDLLYERVLSRNPELSPQRSTLLVPLGTKTETDNLSSGAHRPTRYRSLEFSRENEAEKPHHHELLHELQIPIRAEPDYLANPVNLAPALLGDTCNWYLRR